MRFATTTCAPCPVRDQCTRSTQYGRQLTVRPQDQDAMLERVRTEQATDEWKDRYAARAGVEGTIHQAVTTAGARRTRYVGLAKTHLAHVSHRSSNQPDPSGCLVERHPTRPHTHITADCPRPCRMSELGNGVRRCTRRARGSPGPWSRRCGRGCTRF
ncbi:transposase [Streptomyces samsunensis]|uniref:Transposase n=1 Tax=Streptomyces malaysiensis subsp. samsunensis TaxID=459658 RepID=A0A9X2M6H0_STRMQ|nr:transposase [Streptomyces samsunensis]